VNKLQKILFFSFAALLFFVPIVLWPYTSEVFEFNKMVLVYMLTTTIIGIWAVKSVIEGKFIFRRTILDIPLLVFLGSQLISTVLSIDFYTSVFGYYSRFNGGLLSTLCYLILYWAFVSNFDRKETLKLINIWFASAFIVSIYGVLEHFGIDKNIWVQDVQSRIFSSLGQPNWLAAWVVGLIPIAWAFSLKSKVKSLNFWIYFGLSVLLFWTLIFTKSRSGFLGFGVACIIFWGIIALQNVKNIKSFISPFLITGVVFTAICLISGTQWTPSLASLINKPENKQASVGSGETALETGGTESGTIRKIVWQGALQVWLHYPVFGTGVETFAYSYYLYRPAAHNITSEWNFIYNKAHNEFLNMAANSGTVGIISYLVLIGLTIYQIIKIDSKLKSDSDEHRDFLPAGLLAGFISLSVSNFFGFSVVPTQLQFFLFPAIAFALTESNKVNEKKTVSTNSKQKTVIAILILFASYLLLLISQYWYADILYNRGKELNTASRPDLAIPVLNKAIKFEPNQAIYYGDSYGLAYSFAQVAMAYNQENNATMSAQFTNYTVDGMQKALELSPANVNLRRSAFGLYVRLSTIDEKYLIDARNALIETIKLAPTDAKLYYNLGIADANLSQYELANNDFQKAIELKANYAEARIQYAALLVHLGKPNEAKEQLNYILKNLDPNNETAKQALANIK
jgi:putative inorganic carbon (hco3(-)) transporter